MWQAYVGTALGAPRPPHAPISAALGIFRSADPGILFPSSWYIELVGSRRLDSDGVCRWRWGGGGLRRELCGIQKAPGGSINY